MGGLVAQPEVEQPPLGGVLHEGELVLGFAVGVAQQGDGEVGPQDRSVRSVEGLLEVVVLALPAHQLLVEPPGLRGVVGVGPVPDVAAQQVLSRQAEHAAERAVDLEDVAFEVGDADPYGRAFEDRAEPGLGGVQGLRDHSLRLQRGLGDGLLLGQRAPAQGLGEAGRHGVLEPRAARPEGLAVAVAAAVEDEVGVDAVQGAAERLGVRAVRLDERRAGRPARLRVEGPGTQRLAQQPGHREQPLLELGAGVGGRGHRVHGPAPDRREPAQSALRPVRLRAHAVRPTPARPEKA